MLLLKDVFPDFPDYDAEMSELKVNSVYSLINPSTAWVVWPGVEADVYFWVTLETGQSVGVDRFGVFKIA
jgi:hypothetical protein